MVNDVVFLQVDLRHQDADIRSAEYEKSRYQKSRQNEHVDDIVELGIDLKEFYKSVEWDILGVPAQNKVCNAQSDCLTVLLSHLLFPLR